MPVASAFGTFVRQQYSDDLWRALAQKWDGCLGSQSFTRCAGHKPCKCGRLHAHDIAWSCA
eukprot:1158703-Pelagomonas_calceolata.AAC.1